ncbi:MULTISPECIES: thymidine kinase [Petrotoga]|uniref:Thymidine kinase n=2 Tax=Petrotoga sibirica TaxID=156202 RepID=A0A4R8EVD0_9BACT|nr:MULTISPECIES: thymidine kinase [Petrotoga]KUK83444.1 MAG: Thymidine kinase [Petrotoga mobilis]POZ88208.1 thymidine kinase [Petrotoga sibirica DSM 13575]POZ90323.1 thymidine kinase [Petrotoga sp. SL27]TDX16386.1 thymidine kinase [Petrotoga sibirica]
MATGNLVVIVGPMYSGKTSELISFIEIYTLGKKKIKVFKPLLDNRYNETSIVSHSNTSVKAIPINNSAEILPRLDGDEKAIFIDEIQFLDETLREVVVEMINSGKDVYCAGLDLSYKNNPFKVTSLLMSHADTVIKKKAVCHECGEYRGTMTYKTVENGGEIDVGGFEKYIAVCRDCYLELNKNKQNQNKSQNQGG